MSRDSYSPCSQSDFRDYPLEWLGSALAREAPLYRIDESQERILTVRRYLQDGHDPGYRDDPLTRA